jgi:DNA replication ATP-dependent helicase Dna2
LVSVALRGGLGTDQVAVVTPFRRQAALIRAKIQENLNDASDRVPIVDTVERIQGLTVELVAVSLCSSAPEYAAGISRFLFSPNRLNVAMSRARTKVVLAAAPSLLDVIPDDYEGLKARQRFSSVLGLAGATFELIPRSPSED